ncbi:MAG: hypothetical protein QME14_02190 [Methanobacteriaceae archaeon]|nr:hypothetical protein [Methanobacteriaceae archaeon]
MRNLKENYCWKCPMRTSSRKTFCRELDAWIRLNNALELAIRDKLEFNISSEALNFIQMKYLNKISKKRPLYNRKILLTLKKDFPPYAYKEDIILIDENCDQVKKEDIVLIPEICPLSIHGFSIIKSGDNLPFKMARVSKVFHEGGERLIKTNRGVNVSPQLLIGKIVKILDKEGLNFSKII